LFFTLWTLDYFPWKYENQFELKVIKTTSFTDLLLPHMIYNVDGHIQAEQDHAK
jgi:hypothetical protein